MVEGVVYGFVFEINSKLCSSTHILFSYTSNSPTIETLEPNLAFFVRSYKFFFVTLCRTIISNSASLAVAALPDTYCVAFMVKTIIS